MLGLWKCSCSQFLTESKWSHGHLVKKGRLGKDCQRSIVFRKWSEEGVINGRKEEVGGRYFSIRKILNLVKSITHKQMRNIVEVLNNEIWNILILPHRVKALLLVGIFVCFFSFKKKKYWEYYSEVNLPSQVEIYDNNQLRRLLQILCQKF